MRCACGNPLRLSLRSKRCIICAVGSKRPRIRAVNSKPLTAYEAMWQRRRRGLRVLLQLPRWRRQDVVMGSLV